MIDRLIAWWRRRQRRLDLHILGPTLRRQAPTLSVARQAFYLHTVVDPAWRDMDDEEIEKVIEGLK
jgi:hypothetical protein